MSRGYSGTTTITFEVERYLHNGKMYTGDEEDFPDNAEYSLMSLKISGSSYFTPGKFHALPENCYPDEGDTEIGDILFNGKKWEGTLTDSEEETVKEQIVDAITDGPDGDDDDGFVEPDDYYGED